MVPADRKLYALRDATGTVPSISLISSSIMSKKLAEGLDGLVLDVKTGSGAFMKDLNASRELAKTMVGIGKVHGVETVALITSMDQPLGREVGNANEIRESVEVLRGGGPEDVIELTLALGEVMLELAGVDGGRDRLLSAIEDGSAFRRLVDVAVAHGGDASVLHDPSHDRAGARDGLTLEELDARLPRGSVDGQGGGVTAGQEQDHALHGDDPLQGVGDGHEEGCASQVPRHRPLDLHERRQLVTGEPKVLRRPFEPKLEFPARLGEGGVGAEPLQLDAGAVGEELEDLLKLRLAWHGLAVDHRQMAKALPVGGAQRHAEIAARSHLGQQRVVVISRAVYLHAAYRRQAMPLLAHKAMHKREQLILLEHLALDHEPHA